MEAVDLVIAYVNNQDESWRKEFFDFCCKNNIRQMIPNMLGDRFGGIDFLSWHLKLANKNMPWLRKIFLLVSSKSQLEGVTLPNNVEVVEHEDFIWYQYLPTFNSTTIEMFLWNIPNLGEHFIYANDDMLPCKPMKPSDFFYGDKIRIEWREDEFDEAMNVYAYQCKNCCNSLSYKLGVKLEKDKMIRPVHSYTPMIRSHCKEAFNLIKSEITKHIYAFRTSKQHNQYIYPLYERWKYDTLDSNIDFLYTELDKDFDLNHQIVCVNLEKNKAYKDKFVKEITELCK